MSANLTHEQAMIQFVVVGEPAPQGSKRHVGRGIMIESSKKVKPWREAVKWAAFEHTTGRGYGSGIPVSVGIKFILNKPKTSPKSRLYPDRKPDIDKLVRSTLDAMKEAGVFGDDAQVVELTAWKSFPEGHEVPGALIRVQPARGAMELPL